MPLSEENPVYGPFFGVMGAASAIIFSGKISQRKKRKWKNFANFRIFLNTKIYKSFEVELVTMLLMWILF